VDGAAFVGSEAAVAYARQIKNAVTTRPSAAFINATAHHSSDDSSPCSTRSLYRDNLA